MTRTIIPDKVKLDIYHPDNEPADHANPDADRTPDIHIGPDNGTASHIREASMPSTLGPLKDQASFGVDNYGGRYRHGARKIKPGDEAVFSVQFASNPGEWVERFRGMVGKPKVSGDGAMRSILSWKCGDFVGTVLGWRYLEAGYQNRAIAGETGILEDALDEKCPEIAQDKITPVSKETSRTYNASKMLDVVGGLAALGDSVVSTDARSLVFRPITAISSSWELEPPDFGTFDFEIDDSELANAVRIDGGHAEGVTGQQTTVTGWSRVTKTQRLLVQLDVPKSEVSAVDVWTDPTRVTSGDHVRVRLQKDDGGAPVAIDDNTKDLAARELAYHFLEHDGFTRFSMPQNDILDDNPWLIIEATEDGDGTGQDIGVNNAGVPAHVVYYPFPVSGRKADRESIAEFRRREVQISDTSISSFQALGQALGVQLDYENTIQNAFSFDARSLRAHQLAPGDGIRIDSRTAGVAGDFVVTKRTETYDGAQLSTDVTLHEFESLGFDPTGWGADWGDSWGH